MNATEKNVAMAAKLYECRNAARNILGGRYTEKMREYGDAVRAVATEHGCGELEAGIRLANATGDGMAAILVLAATVEIIEPSNALDQRPAAGRSGASEG